MSAPAANARSPAPVMTMARQSGSASSSSSVRTSSVIVAWSMALRTAGRSMVTSATPGRGSPLTGSVAGSSTRMGLAAGVVSGSWVMPLPRGGRRPCRTGGRGRRRSGRSSERQNATAAWLNSAGWVTVTTWPLSGTTSRRESGSWRWSFRAWSAGTNTSRSPTTTQRRHAGAAQLLRAQQVLGRDIVGDRAQEVHPAAGALGGRVPPVELRGPAGLVARDPIGVHEARRDPGARLPLRADARDDRRVEALGVACREGQRGHRAHREARHVEALQAQGVREGAQVATSASRDQPAIGSGPWVLVPA